MISRSKKKSRFSLNRAVSMNEQLTVLNSSFSHPINEENEDDDENVQKKQVRRQIGIFEEFKIKYDELRKQNQEKRNQIDELKKVNKRLQIQLLNINTEFYDKEIKRLRAEVDKLQEQSEDFKFKYFESQNKRKQLESTLTINQKQMAKMIKQFQSQKVQNAQLKHQIKQNQKQYLNIITTVEQSSNASAKRYADCQSKLNLVENQLKKCKRDLQTQRKNLQKNQKTKHQIEQQHKKLIEKLQIQIKNTKKQLDDSQDQSRSYRKQISLLKENISQINLEISKLKSLQQFQTSKNFEKINQFRSTRLLQIQNKRFKEELQTVKKQLQTKTLSLKTIQTKFDQLKQSSEIQKKQNDQKLLDLQNKKTAIQKHYETKNLNLNKQIEILKIKCIRIQSEEENKKPDLNFSKLTQSQNNIPIFQRKLAQNQKQESPLLAFQNTVEEVLQGKDQQILLLKKTLNDKIEEIYKLKQQIEDGHILTESLKNQLSILQKKLSVQQKNLSGKNEIELFEMKSKIDSLQRKLSQTESKLQAKIKQSKEKDTFIVDSIISRIQKQQEAPLILAEMQRILQGGYIEKLTEAENKIKAMELKLSPKTA